MFVPFFRGKFSRRLGGGNSECGLGLGGSSALSDVDATPVLLEWYCSSGGHFDGGLLGIVVVGVVVWVDSSSWGDTGFAFSWW